MSTTYKILLVDDHQLVIDGIKSLLANTQYIVTEEALNGQEAMSKITATPDAYDILISDISMPLLTGTELCKTVKQNYPKIKVLLLSMYSSTPTVKEVVTAEADGFMLKNSGREELLNALHKVVNDSTYYSSEIIPIIYNQIAKEKAQKDNITVLTEREREILTLIVREYTSEEIANKLSVSKKTVDNHRANILEKTKSKSTIGLVKYALKNGIE